MLLLPVWVMSPSGRFWPGTRGKEETEGCWGGRRESHTSVWRVSSHHTPAGSLSASRGLWVPSLREHPITDLPPFSLPTDEDECIKTSTLEGRFLFFNFLSEFMVIFATVEVFSPSAAISRSICWRRGQRRLLISALRGLQTPPDYCSQVSGGLCVTQLFSSITPRAARKQGNLLLCPEI